MPHQKKKRQEEVARRHTLSIADLGEPELQELEQFPPVRIQLENPEQQDKRQHPNGGLKSGQAD